MACEHFTLFRWDADKCPCGKRHCRCAACDYALDGCDLVD